MLNPDPKKFYTLPEVFDLVGRELAGKRWTGEERYALDLPPTEIADEVFDMLLGYDGTPVRGQPWRSLWESRGQLSEALARGARRNKARGVESPTVVGGEPESSEECRERLLDEVYQRRRDLPRRTVRLPAEWETWPELGSPEYIREFEARQRRDKVEAELRRVCHDNDSIAVLFDPDTGELKPLPCAWWWADTITSRSGPRVNAGSEINVRATCCLNEAESTICCWGAPQRPRRPRWLPLGLAPMPS